MAYYELIKSFAKIRGYLREFYVYGFKHRMDMDAKSARSYDNERRRVESWLGDYMRFAQDADGKRMYLSVDSRMILQNPLYKAFKAKSFTDNDVMLHFYVLDLLPEEEGLTIREVIDNLEVNYLEEFDAHMLDESTIRKKLKEYEQLGLVEREKIGRETVYRKKTDEVELASWKDAVVFFSEAAPLGVVGSYLIDKYKDIPNFFLHKHHYIMKALDSEILYTLFHAIGQHSMVKLTMLKSKESIQTVPFKIYISAQYGRQYLLAWNANCGQFKLYRLDHILYASVGEEAKDWDSLCDEMNVFTCHLWGVAWGNEKLEHVEFEITIAPYEEYVVQRLRREKRCGEVRQIDEDTWGFSADVYSVKEMMPWIRTFMGRITAFRCSNTSEEERFLNDMNAMYDLYGIQDMSTEEAGRYANAGEDCEDDIS